MESLQLSIAIARNAHDAYAYISNVANMPEWADGVDTSAVTFVPENDYGILDHTVALPDGETLTVHMRVLPLGDGSEVVFTLRRAEGMSDAAFAGDRAAVEKDLAQLKAFLEG